MEQDCNNCWIDYGFLLGLLNNTFFRNIQNQYYEAVANPLDPKTREKESNLVKEANEFNNLITKFIQIQKYEVDWKEKLEVIFTEAGFLSVNIKRILVSAAPANNITIQGEANKKSLIVDFKDALDNSNIFSDISLPLSALIDTPKGVTFNLSIKI